VWLLGSSAVYRWHYDTGEVLRFWLGLLYPIRAATSFSKIVRRRSVAAAREITLHGAPDAAIGTALKLRCTKMKKLFLVTTAIVVLSATARGR
jgi:hypothetical protein